MRNDHDTPTVQGAPVTGVDAPPPPPPMPTATPRSAVTQAGTQAGTQAPARELIAQARSGWEVDPSRLTDFVHAVDLVRLRLREVQDQVERMQGNGYTPRLGTSPVGTQLERKFADRLDAPIDNPAHPTSGGLRPMLAEAMRRMDEFVSGAEDAARHYQELDDTAKAHLGQVRAGSVAPAVTPATKG